MATPISATKAPEMTTTYCITGVSGYIGGLLAARLAGEGGNRVIGIDLKAPANPAGISFYQEDIRAAGIAEILRAEKVDVFIHLAFYTAPEGDSREAESVNVGGTRNILRAVEEAGVRRFVLASSAAVYGSHSDNPVSIKEAEPLRANDFFYYSKHKAQQEELTREFLGRNPRTRVVILRPCVLIGPHINNPTGASLREKVLIFIRGAQPPIQLIYEDDAAEAFYLAATKDGEGVFNVAAEGTLTYPELARMMNKRIILLPFPLLAALATLGKWLGLSPVSATTLRFIRNSIVIDPAKFNRRFGFKPLYDSHQAFRRFVSTL